MTRPAQIDNPEPYRPRHWSLAALLLLVAAVATSLLWPALFNRFPLIFPDTPAYLGVAYGDYWTLDRSGFYGLALKPLLTTMEPVAALWLSIVLQSIVIVCVLVLVVRTLAPRLSPGKAAAVILAIVMLTSLPWHAVQLMPDAFTGVLVVMVWLAASRKVGAAGTALLWLGAGLLAVVHYTHLGLLLAVAVATLTALALSGTPLRDIAARAAAALLVTAAVAAAHVAVNGTHFGRWTVSPMSNLFLFARLHEDGLAARWLDRHCGRDAPAPLCAIRSQLPSDSQILLWGGTKSPLTARVHDQIGQPGSWQWMDMLGTAVKGSIRDEPLAFAISSVSGGAQQLVHWRALDDECPGVCRKAMQEMVVFRPSLADPLYRSRQLTGEMDRRSIRSVTTPLPLVGQLLLLPFLLVAIRRRDPIAISMIVAVVAALLANALMAGALSDVHDRYQSRLVWLAPFAVLTLAARWQLFRPRPVIR